VELEMADHHIVAEAEAVPDRQVAIQLVILLTTTAEPDWPIPYPEHLYIMQVEVEVVAVRHIPVVLEVVEMVMQLLAQELPTQAVGVVGLIKQQQDQAEVA
jgi:hypothetical protein